MYWWVTSIKEQVDKYWGMGAIGILFLGAVLYLYAGKEKNREIKVHLWHVLLLGIFQINPILFIVMERQQLIDVYERFFWLFLSPLVICVVGVLISKQKKWMWVPVLLLLVLCGNTVYTSIEFKPAENVYKISQEAIEVNDIIMRDYEGLAADEPVIPNRQGLKAVRAMIAEPICEDIRMYNANIEMLFVRRDLGSYIPQEAVAVNLLMDAENVNMDAVAGAMREGQYSYAVFSVNHILPYNMEDYALEQIGNTKSYIIYKMKNKGGT